MPRPNPTIIKIGSAVLADEQGRVDEDVIAALVEQCAHLHKEGRVLCLVSSGAIGAGMAVMESGRPRRIKKRQALAAVGQVRLMEVYQREFARHGIRVGQVLLSHEDLAQRTSFLNTRSTLEELLGLGVVPIVNENDSVSTEEIEFGDNDRLAVLIANVIEAKEVLFLSTTDGLIDFGGTGQLLSEVNGIDSKILSMARGGNSMGRGGMSSKLMSIDILNRSGKTGWLANGKRPEVLLEWHRGLPVGTRFEARKVKTSSKKQWMLQHLGPKGKLEVDAGALAALKKGPASLLSVGVTSVSGQFKEGQLLSVRHEGREFARGMSRMEASTLKGLLGKSRAEVLELLHQPGVVIHRNDIVFVEGQGG